MVYDDDEDPFPAPEPYQVPKDAKKIRERIRRYERALEQEKRRLGNYRDGSGKRFLLGPLYMILGDLEGALKSFAWFEAAFPDGADEAPQLLCWSLALHRAGQDIKARPMLRRTMLANLYILPQLLGMEVRERYIELGHAERKASLPDSFGSLRLLSQFQTTSVAGSQLADAA